MTNTFLYDYMPYLHPGCITLTLNDHIHSTQVFKVPSTRAEIKTAALSRVEHGRKLNARVIFTELQSLSDMPAGLEEHTG